MIKFTYKDAVVACMSTKSITITQIHAARSLAADMAGTVVDEIIIKAS